MRHYSEILFFLIVSLIAVSVGMIICVLAIQLDPLDEPDIDKIEVTVISKNETTGMVLLEDDHGHQFEFWMNDVDEIEVGQKFEMFVEEIPK